MAKSLKKIIDNNHPAPEVTRAPSAGKSPALMSKSETEGNIMEEIKKAIQALGFRAGTVVSVSAMRSGRALVSINGDPFGVWDNRKKTFVD